jgi:hypothetical protein
VSFASYGTKESTQISTSSSQSKPVYKSFRGGSDAVVEIPEEPLVEESPDIEISYSEDIRVGESEDGCSLFSTG